jgi:hypothetical protein
VIDGRSGGPIDPLLDLVPHGTAKRPVVPCVGHDDQVFRPAERLEDATRVVRRRVAIERSMDEQNGDGDPGGRSDGAHVGDFEAAARFGERKRPANRRPAQDERRPLVCHGLQIRERLGRDDRGDTSTGRRDGCSKASAARDEGAQPLKLTTPAVSARHNTGFRDILKEWTSSLRVGFEQF